MQANPAADVTFVDEGHLNVNLVPGTTAGTGTLALVTGTNLQVNLPISVKSLPISVKS